MSNIFLGEDLQVIYTVYDSNNNPIPGLYPSDIKCFYLTPTNDYFIEKVLTPAVCEDLDLGTYRITYTYPTEVGSIGRFVSYVYGEDYNVIDYDVSTISVPVTACAVTGNLVGMTGEPVCCDIVFENLVNPFYTQGKGVGGQRLIVSTDPAGYFAASLIRGLKVRVAISKLGITRTIEIPDQSAADLFELIADSPSEYEPY